MLSEEKLKESYSEPGFQGQQSQTLRSEEAKEGAAFRLSQRWDPWAISLWKKTNLLSMKEKWQGDGAARED